MMSFSDVGYVVSQGEVLKSGYTWVGRVVQGRLLVAARY